MGPRVVPWRDWDEWEAVRVGLTGDDPGSRDVALRSVDAWRTRGWVPHAVDVTAQLMEARMHDRGVPGSPGAFDRVDPTTVTARPRSTRRFTAAASVVFGSTQRDERRVPRESQVFNAFATPSPPPSSALTAEAPPSPLR